MVTLDIRLSATESIRSFVNLTNKYPFHISLSQGRSRVDAKSILGIYRLDLTRPVCVEIYDDHAHELISDLDGFIA